MKSFYYANVGDDDSKFFNANSFPKPRINAGVTGRRADSLEKEWGPEGAVPSGMATIRIQPRRAGGAAGLPSPEASANEQRQEHPAPAPLPVSPRPPLCNERLRSADPGALSPESGLFVSLQTAHAHEPP